ncbi:hypothetical protein NE237_002653 [Protea cynaroides]|uniref:Uncharacterized protein n=1 Tax=Protea cynaroides TaxID=273540 RepID=A0A9Q0GLQ6_9MAGN|nr:hypothetical protein NE237_002653 [Protea cynaroides]
MPDSSPQRQPNDDQQLVQLSAAISDNCGLLHKISPMPIPLSAPLTFPQPVMDDPSLPSHHNSNSSNPSFGETQNILHGADCVKEIPTKAFHQNKDTLQIPESEIDQANLMLQLQKGNRKLRVPANSSPIPFLVAGSSNTTLILL